MSPELPSHSMNTHRCASVLAQRIGPAVPEGKPVTLSDIDRSLAFIQTAGDVIEHLIENGLVDEARLTEHLAGDK